MHIEKLMKVQVLLCFARVVVGALLFLGGLASSVAQEGAPGQVFFDALAFAGEAGEDARLDMYLAVPYSAVEFEREESGFTARYRVELKVESVVGTIFDSTITRTVVTSDYARTSGGVSTFDFFQKRIPMLPGDYTVTATMTDYGTNLTHRIKRNVTVIDFPAYKFALSGLMLVSKIRERTESSGYAITPMLTDNVSLAKGAYFLFFEAYNYTGVDSFLLTARYRTEEGEVVWSETFGKNIPEGRTQQWLRLPTEGIGRGAYIAEVTAVRADMPTDTLAAAKRIVGFLGTAEGLPISEGELDERVSRLRYVATQSEIDYIEDGGTFRERQKRYAEFWDAHDPSPGTPLNEAMVEYFRRIDYANKNFRSYAEGWLTDMGRIYIVYGPADRVDRDPFPSDGKPREVWEYYGRHMSLLFIDQTGFGDYRLMTSVPLSEKYRY